MDQTTMAKPAEIARAWYLVDATGIPLGRLASRIAQILMGKTKPIYTPNEDVGDYVIVVNAGKVKLTGYNGGLRTRSAGTMLREYPVEMVERAVWGMLPKGPLGRKMLKKLHVYAGETHENGAQKPVALDLSK